MTHTHLHRFDGLSTLQDLKDAMQIVDRWPADSYVSIHSDQIEIWYTEDGGQS